jgi:hypothetical protein
MRNEMDLDEEPIMLMRPGNIFTFYQRLLPLYGCIPQRSFIQKARTNYIYTVRTYRVSSFLNATDKIKEFIRKPFSHGEVRNVNV